MLLKAMCKQYESVIGHERFTYYARMYDKQRDSIIGSMNGCAYDLYGCFMSILRDKVHERYHMIYAAIVLVYYEERGSAKKKRHKIVYRSESDNMGLDSLKDVAKETDVDVVDAISW
jgi:hypothetical protein